MSGPEHDQDIARAAAELLPLWGDVDDREAALMAEATNLFTHDANVTRDEIGGWWGRMAWLLAGIEAERRGVPVEAVIEEFAFAWARKPEAAT